MSGTCVTSTMPLEVEEVEAVLLLLPLLMSVAMAVSGSVHVQAE